MVSSGVPALDPLLGDGYPDKSTTLIVGPPGIGKEALGYWFTQSGLAQGDFCLYVTRLSAKEVLQDEKGFGIDTQERVPLLLASDGGQIKYDVNPTLGSRIRSESLGNVFHGLSCAKVCTAGMTSEA